MVTDDCPMAKLEDHNPITATGSYEFPYLMPGTEYLLCVKSDADYSASLNYWDDASRKFRACNDGELANSEDSEKRFIAPSRRMGISVTAVTSPISVTFTQITK